MRDPAGARARREGALTGKGGTHRAGYGKSLFTDRVPARPGVTKTTAANHGGPVHFPDTDFPAGVLKHDVGVPVAVVVAGADHVPAWPGIAETAATDHVGAVHLPNHDFPIGVLPQDVGVTVAIEVTGYLLRSQLERAASQLCQPYEPEVPVKVREWIAAALASSDFVPGAVAVLDELSVEPL